MKKNFKRLYHLYKLILAFPLPQLLYHRLLICNNIALFGALQASEDLDCNCDHEILCADNHLGTSHIKT